MADRLPSAFLDKFAQFFEYLVAVEQLATRSLRGAAFQFRFQLLKRRCGFGGRCIAALLRRLNLHQRVRRLIR
jgi:hypothetical protein